MAEGNRRVLQDDFSAGAFPLASYDQIPGNGVFDAQNLLVDDDRSLKIRGGSRWAAPAMSGGSRIHWMWAGTIGTTPRVIGGTHTGLAAFNDSTGVTTNIASSVPSRAPGVSLAGLLFVPGGATISPTLTVGAAALPAWFYAVAGNRLWAANLDSTRIDFSDVGNPGTFGATSFHQIPEGGIRGIIGLRDAVVVFTTAGVWIISNVGMNLTDAAGNVQHRIDRYSRSLSLWSADALGATYEESLIVPARDGVYLLSYGVSSEAPQAFTLISRPIASLYRAYAQNPNYGTGQLSVYRGHLILPIVDNTTVNGVVDTFVCNLDATDSSGRRTFPWVRLAATSLRAESGVVSVHTGNLLGGAMTSNRPMTLDYFDRSLSTTDADGQSWATVLKTRAPVTPDDAATLANYLNDVGGSTALSGFAGDNSLTERVPWSWRVAKPARYSTIEVAQAGAPSVFRVKSFEWFIREHGRV
jgi:hypothetical protein